MEKTKVTEYLKPCPFCASSKVKLHRNFDYVYCENCGARGTYFDGHPVDAINAWNQRIIIPPKMRNKK